MSRPLFNEYGNPPYDNRLDKFGAGLSARVSVFFASNPCQSVVEQRAVEQYLVSCITGSCAEHRLRMQRENTEMELQKLNSKAGDNVHT